MAPSIVENHWHPCDRNEIAALYKERGRSIVREFYLDQVLCEEIQAFWYIYGKKLSNMWMGPHCSEAKLVYLYKGTEKICVHLNGTWRSRFKDAYKRRRHHAKSQKWRLERKWERWIKEADRLAGIDCVDMDRKRAAGGGNKWGKKRRKISTKISYGAPKTVKRLTYLPDGFQVEISLVLNT